jgi:hypothetical protein
MDQNWLSNLPGELPELWLFWEPQSKTWIHAESLDSVTEAACYLAAPTEADAEKIQEYLRGDYPFVFAVKVR